MSERMELKRAWDFDQDLLILFDAYVHGDIDRRGFLEKGRASPRAASPPPCCWAC